MAKTAHVHEAKAHLSELLRQVEAGDTVLITRAGKPVARLVPVAGARRVLGMDNGLGSISDDFNAPLPEGILRQFRG